MPLAVLVPAVQGKLSDRVRAAPADHQPAAFQQLGSQPDAGQHLVVRPFHPPAPPAQGLAEAGRRRIGDHGPKGSVPHQLGIHFPRTNNFNW